MTSSDIAAATESVEELAGIVDSTVVGTDEENAAEGKI